MHNNNRHNTGQHLLNEGLTEIFSVAAALPEDQRARLEEAARLVREAFAAAEAERSALAERSMTDALTGLPNRLGIMAALEDRMGQIDRYGNKDLAVVFIDLDGFKGINDALGHDVGDQALKDAAQRLKGGLRGTDVVGRLGGDEMLLLLSYEGDEQFCEDTVREKVRSYLDGLVYWQGLKPFPLGASIGISFRGRGQSFGEGTAPEQGAQMVKEADQAMYKDKAGKAARLEAARQRALEDISFSPAGAVAAPKSA